MSSYYLVIFSVSCQRIRRCFSFPLIFAHVVFIYLNKFCDSESVDYFRSYLTDEVILSRYKVVLSKC